MPLGIENQWRQKNNNKKINKQTSGELKNNKIKIK